MGRSATKPAAPTPEVLLNEVALDTRDNSVTQMGQIRAGYEEERDLLNQLLGQAQMADAFERFSRTVRTSKMAFVKENKLYRTLKGTKTANGSLFSGTWEEFCELLGTSRDKVELDIANLRAFGEEALESMSKMGIGYRELRQYRRLPEDQKQALIEVAKSGDKEGFVELAEEIIAKSAKEKEALQKNLQDAKDQADDLASGKKDLESKVSQLRKEAKRLERATPDEVAAHLRAEIEKFTLEVQGLVNGPIRDGLEQLRKHGDDHGIAQDGWMAGQLAQLVQLVKKVGGRVGVEVADDELPVWAVGLQQPATPQVN